MAHFRLRLSGARSARRGRKLQETIANPWVPPRGAGGVLVGRETRT